MNVAGHVVDLKSFLEFVCQKWELKYLVEQRQMTLVNLIEFWTFILLFLFFKTFEQYTKMASTWDTEGLVCEAIKQMNMPLYRKQQV